MKDIEMHGIFHGLATLASPSESKANQLRRL